MGSIRVTEQGEMIRYKLGLPEIACQNMELYLNAMLEMTLSPAQPPLAEDVAMIESMAAQGVQAYRAVVRGNPDFVPYFREITPEGELSRLPLGSRPAKRKADGGVESLRAIPWIFAWMQIRLMLPAWLGTDQCLSDAIESGQLDRLREMLNRWPFFKVYIDMLEMVLAKTDRDIAAYYEERLCTKDSSRQLGEMLRQRLQVTIDVVNAIKSQDELLAGEPMIAQSLSVRDPYTDPLHFLQAELLLRAREQGAEPGSPTERALMVSMLGLRLA